MMMKGWVFLSFFYLLYLFMSLFFITGLSASIRIVP